MLPILAKFLVFALITRVLVLSGTLPGVQPSRTLSLGPTDEPLGPHRCSGRTPWLVVGSNAPITDTGTGTPAIITVVVGAGRFFGSMMKRPPSQNGAGP